MSLNLADVQERRLANGLRVLVREDHTSPVVALNFWVRVGSNNESDDLMGWSHGVEHMLFKGTARRPTGAIAREIKNAGGETNAGTGYETTNYHIVVPREEFRRALDIHADVLMNSVFDPGELENERQVLIEENQMYRDRPSGYGRTWEELFRLGFRVHRYRSPIGGPDQNLRDTPRDRIVGWKERYYVPGNIVYVITGDVTAGEAFAAVEEALAGFPARALDHDTSPPEPEQQEFRFQELEGDVARIYGKIGFHIPPELAPESDAVQVLAHILGVGRSSRLYRHVREDQSLVASIGVMSVDGFDPGYLIIDFTCDPGKAVDALTAIFVEMERLVDAPPAADELDRTKNMVKSDFVFGLETVEGQASILGHYATLGDLARAADYPDRIARVTGAEVQAAARRYFGVARASVVLYRPRGAALVEDPARLESRLRTATRGAGGGRPSTGEVSARFDVTRTRLENGLTLLVERQPQLPIVAVAAYLPCGSGEETPETNGRTHLMQQMLLKGAAGRGAEAIALELESLGAHLRPFAGRDVSGLSLSTLRENLDRTLPIFRDLIRRPDFPEEALGREKERLLSDLAALRDNTLHYTMQHFTRALFQGHPYALPVMGSLEAVPRLDRGLMAEWHARHYVPERMVISVVGDLSPEEGRALIDAHFGAMPAGPALGVVPPVAAEGQARRVTLEKEVAQSVIVLGCPGPSEESPDRYALDVLMSVLSGMGNRLFCELRDRQHLCYFTGAFASTFRRGGAVGAYIGTRPENEERAVEGLLEELRKATREPPTDEEMRRAKNTIAGGYVIDLQRRAARASLLAQEEASGLGYEEALRFLDRIRAVTPDEVQAVAARYFQLDRVTLAVLKPGAS